MPDEAPAPARAAPHQERPAAGRVAEDGGAALSARVRQTIGEAAAGLRALQRGDGHWLFELEADATIPAEYILLGHFLDEIDPATEARLGAYIRARQAAHGGWPLFHGGDFDLSCTVKAYYALRLIGDDPEAPHMARARAAVLAAGGAARCNVFTRVTLALFGQVPWRAVPSMPVEIVFLPRWFPFHLSKISYWSRTTLVPLMILLALRPRARNPQGVGVAELFATSPDRERRYFPRPAGLQRLFFGIDRALRLWDRAAPRALRRRAIDKALGWCADRLNGEDGLGAIFPPMANVLMAFDALGYGRDHPARATARRAIDRLLAAPEGGSQYLQPCVSPIWDTGLAALCLMECGGEADRDAAERALPWLAARQIRGVEGDWAVLRPGVAPGGWAFQYRNDFYPDVDDTAVVAMALHRAAPAGHGAAIERAAKWIVAMQGARGGWGSFDVDNEYDYLNHIPFADHGALLDPPTADVSARCVSFLCQTGSARHRAAVARGVAYLLAEQEEDGSWFGRWGTNYIYGTWSVLSALNAAGEDPDSPAVRKAVAWLEARQHADGGWGETGDSYYRERIERSFESTSTPSQTAWALLALMAAGEVESLAVRRGVAWLCRAERQGARWREDEYTAVGFPRVFYLRYHGYGAYFPLWALARYRNLSCGNDRRPRHGM